MRRSKYYFYLGLAIVLSFIFYPVVYFTDWLYFKADCMNDDCDCSACSGLKRNTNLRIG